MCAGAAHFSPGTQTLCDVAELSVAVLDASSPASVFLIFRCWDFFLVFAKMGCCGWCGPQLVLLVKSESVFAEMLSAASKRLLWLLVKVAALCANPIVKLVNLRRPKRLPRISNPLLLNSATRLAQMIRTQQVRNKNYFPKNLVFFSVCKIISKEVEK